MKTQMFWKKYAYWVSWFNTIKATEDKTNYLQLNEAFELTMGIDVVNRTIAEPRPKYTCMNKITM